MRVGFGKTDVSPPPGGGDMDLRVLGFWDGRALRYGPVHDPLCARAAVFAAGDDAVCLVSVDMICDGVGFGALARERIRRGLGLPADRVMVACTHAHTTPDMAPFSDHAVSPRYVEFVADGIAEAARQAVASLQPCALSLGEAQLAGVALNRTAAYGGSAVQALSPQTRQRDLALDETLRAASARTESGAEAGVMVNFACHGVCVQAQPMISADYPGFAMRRLEERGAGVALFTNGACGDADPTRMGAMQDLEWVGGRVAEAAANVCASSMTPVRGERVGGSRRSILLPRRPMGDVAELERRWTRLAAEAAATAQRPDRNHPERTPHHQLFWAREALTLARMPQQIPVELQALKIGDWLLLGVPAELAGALARDMRAAARRHRLWLIGYANGYIGYAVPRSFFDVKGNYETQPGIWSRLAPGAGEQLRDAAVEFIRELEK